MEAHLATVVESVADVVSDEIAVVQGDQRRTWHDLDDRSARLAGGFLAAGVGVGASVAEYLYNSPEYLETYLAALKIRAVPVNVNFRYLDDELAYLLDNAEAEVLVFHSSLGDRVARVMARASTVKLYVEVDDGGPHVEGAVRYEDLVASADPAPRIRRDPSDVTMFYTGGTTGMPKGVMNKVGSAVQTLMTSAPPILGYPAVAEPADIAPVVAQLAAEGRLASAMPACPLMHGTGLTIGALPSLVFGGKVVLLEGRGLDPDEVWTAVERERVGYLTIVGDAFSRPLLRALDDGPPRDLSSLAMILSSGAMFSPEIKAGLIGHVPQLAIIDFIAATEGLMGLSIATKDAPAVTGRFMPSAGVKVFAEDGHEVAPGSGETGVVALSAGVPDGYFKDEAKSAATFREVDGVRYSFPGDWATVEEDGSLTLLGRGSQCINTGGEKVFPEEVEEAVKRHPDVDDCLVFGVPDERFGQRVVAVASVRPGASVAPEDVLADLHGRLSGYKVPRRLELVDVVPRIASGKADYPAARELFEAVTPPR
jgi:acyl-CoA synthetase (AMP-forming)/AMP-acid ligase II